MSILGNEIKYTNALTGEMGQYQIIAKGDFGPYYSDQEHGKLLFLYENPLSRVLTGLDADQVERGHECLRVDLRARLEQRINRAGGRLSQVIILADALSECLARLGEPMRREAEAILDLPGDTRPGKNRARLRDHFLLTSGIAVALAHALLIKGYRPGEIASGLSHFDEQEALALLRLAAMCHDIGKHPPKGHIERGQAFVREVFADLLTPDVVDEIAEGVRRHHAGRRYRLAGIAPESLMQEIVCYADSVASGADRPGDPGFNFPGYDDVREWERRYFGDDAPLALIAADVDRVQGYVFESAKLAEMRGGSLILDLLNVKHNDDKERWGDFDVGGQPVRGIPQVLADEFRLPLDAIIYAAGGGAMIVAPRALAEQIKQRIERLYVDTTLTATITVVYQPVRLRELALGIDPLPVAHWFHTKARRAQGEAWRIFKHNLVSDREKWGQHLDPSSLADKSYHDSKCFGQWQTALGYDLRRAKQSKAFAPVFEVSPFSERCAYCQLRPAYDLRDDRSICQVCRRKRQEGGARAAHSFYVNRFRAYLQSEDRRGNELPYLKGMRKCTELTDWSYLASPPDLEAVAEASGGSYVGIIYADGNDMGAMLDQLETPAAFRSFAQEVRAALERAVFDGLGRLLDGPRKPWRVRRGDRGLKQETYHYHPFEIVSIGGDDVYLFVPADVALELALHIGREFEQAFDRRLTLAAGVLIAHVSTPIYFSRNIVKGLLSSAKKRSKAGGQAVSAVDFQVITADTAVSEEIKEFRDSVYKKGLNERLTTRPLLLDALAELIGVACRLRDERFPKSQLYALREAVVRGPAPRASNYYRYQLARSGAYRLLDEYLTRASKGDEGLLPFFRATNGALSSDLVTPVVDLVEIYDFVRRNSAATNTES